MLVQMLSARGLKKNLGRIVAGLSIVAAFYVHQRTEFEFSFVTAIERIASDARLRLFMPGGVDPQVVILDIDEKSLKEREQGGEGRWPWPRDRLALLVDKLFDKYQIEVLSFDVVFAERDETSGIRQLNALANGELKTDTQFQKALIKLRPQLDYDAVFADRLRNRKVVLGYAFNSDPGVKGLLPPPVFSDADIDKRNIPSTLSIQGYSANIEILQTNAASGGHFTPDNDGDGVLRKVPMVIQFDGQHYESLALATVRSYLGLSQVKLKFNRAAQEDAELAEISMDGLKIPVDHFSRAIIPYRGPRGSFEYISISDVLNDRVDVARLRGKLVLVGTSAAGLKDHSVAPTDTVYPGVEAHANLIAGILNETLKSEPAHAHGVQLLVFVALGVALALLLPMLSIVASTALSTLLLASLIGANLGFYQYGNMVLPIAANLLLILAMFAMNAIWGYAKESRSKKQITGLFGQYVPPEIVSQMAQDPDNISFEPDSRECTVLFTDVRGFTTISEGLDPKELSALMNEFLTTLTAVIFKHGGTIDKYMGDCIMAFWGAPLQNVMHAQTGVIAGIEMHQALNELQPKLKARGWPEIKIGVGLNTGRVSVGNMGSKIRIAYTVMGDAVNLASRLEGITKEYGADIIVGEETMKAAPGVVFRELDRVRVKGKKNAVTIYQPMGLRGEISDDIAKSLQDFQHALTSYRRQDWGAATAILQRLQGVSPQDKLFALFLDRISALRDQRVRPDWDGTFPAECAEA